MEQQERDGWLAKQYDNDKVLLQFSQKLYDILNLTIRQSWPGSRIHPKPNP